MSEGCSLETSNFGPEPRLAEYVQRIPPPASSDVFRFLVKPVFFTQRCSDRFSHLEKTTMLVFTAVRNLPQFLSVLLLRCCHCLSSHTDVSWAVMVVNGNFWTKLPKQMEL